MGGEDHVQNTTDDDGLPGRHAEEDVGDLAGSEGHHAHDEAVEEQPEVEGAEAAHDRGGGAGVAVFVELEVGHDARAAPEAGEEKDRRHAGEHEGPPLPVAGDAVFAHLLGHPVRGVGRERRRHHRETGEPPRHRAAGGEELGGAAAGALGEEERGYKADQDRSRDDDPINPGNMHGRVRGYLFLFPPTLRGNRVHFADMTTSEH